MNGEEILHFKNFLEVLKLMIAGDNQCRFCVEVNTMPNVKSSNNDKADTSKLAQKWLRLEEPHYA
jgi:hypothetical protein